MTKVKLSVGSLITALVVGGISAQASGILNTPSGGYLVCVNSKTKVVTHPGTSNCPKGSDKLVLGAQGEAGVNGLSGAAGLNGLDGKDGKDGKTLWNGVKDPENTWGAPGDMFINSVTKTLFGPKDLTTGWPAGVSIVGPKGDQGPIGLTGPQGPAGANGTNAMLTCAQGGTCVLGDTGPGGGIVFYVQSPTTAYPWRYMEVAPGTWNGGGSDPQSIWCSNTSSFVPNLLTGSSDTVQTFMNPGAGYSNTQKMLRGCTFGAANVVAAYKGGGKSDWHLPSAYELAILGDSRLALGSMGSFYWSSSENSAGVSWLGFLNNNGLAPYTKSLDIAYVRPVRSF
jgi:hypothetical protein